MKILFDAADRYIRRSDWKDLTLVKFCLFSMGLICGMYVKDKQKKPFALGAFLVFTATYIPLMSKFFSVLKNEYHRSLLDMNMKTEI